MTQQPADRDADNAPSEPCLGFCGQGRDPGACQSGCAPDAPSVEEPWREYAEPLYAMFSPEDAEFVEDIARACVAVEERRTAELRAEVERQAVLLRAINDCHLDPARAILQADKIAGAAILRAKKAEAEVERLRGVVERVNEYADLVVLPKRAPMALDLRTITAGLQIVFGPVPTEDGA